NRTCFARINIVTRSQPIEGIESSRLRCAVRVENQQIRPRMEKRIEMVRVERLATEAHDSQGGEIIGGQLSSTNNEFDYARHRLPNRNVTVPNSGGRPETLGFVERDERPAPRKRHEDIHNAEIVTQVRELPPPLTSTQVEILRCNL